MVHPQGRIVVQLQTAPIGQRPLEALLAAYKAKPNVVVVLFLTNSRPIAGALQAAARRLDMARPVHVQPLRVDRRSR